MKIAKARDELKEALEYLEKFNDAARYDGNDCSCFSHLEYTDRKELTKEISIYLETWVLPKLKRALEELK